MGATARRFRENASEIVALLVTGTWLSAMLLGIPGWLPFMLFGYIVVVPIVSILFDEDEEDASEQADVDHDWQSEYGRTTENDRHAGADDESAEDALQTLRERYAKGELTDQQFERKLERLLETETLEDAEERSRRMRSTIDDQETDLETETE